MDEKMVDKNEEELKEEYIKEIINMKRELDVLKVQISSILKSIK